jgi:Flp pilus assembly protein CpaB
MEAARARQVARPAWLNLRTALGMVLFSIALLSGQRLLSDARVTSPVWTAARDLPAYAEITPGDLASVGVRLPAGLLERYARPSADLSGVVLTRAVRAGEMIAVDWLASGAGAQAGRSMTIPVTPEQVFGGDVRVGDHLDVLVTLDAGDVRARTLVLAGDVEVVGVVRASGFVESDSSVVGVTVAVTPEEEVELAFGLRTGQIDLARVVGGSDYAPSETVTGDDFP